MLTRYLEAHRMQQLKMVSILEHMKPLDPVDPNKKTPKAQNENAKSIFDCYTPIKMKKPNVNKRCYWDKRTFKIKADLERSVEKAADRRRYEQFILNQEHMEAEIAESANRRSNLEGELYLL